MGSVTSTLISAVPPASITSETPREYTESVATLETGERHLELLEPLLAELDGYSGRARPRPHRQGVPLRRRGARRPAAPLRGAVHHAPRRRRDDLRRPAPRRADDRGRAPARRRRGHRHEPRRVRDEFGDEIAQLVDGVTKLTRVQFQSREQAEAENYRKMVVAMAEDVRVILVKLADRLHNLRTIEYLGRQKQIQKAKEALEVYAPLAHRLGIHAVKWELEDLSFQTLHPRKYDEIKTMVAERRADREGHVAEAADVLAARAREGRHPRGDLRAREALLLDLRQDGEARPRVQRDLRPHRDARHRRARRRGGNARLLRRARPDPLALEADAGPLQGLRRDAEVQRLPLAAHDGDRSGGASARDPGAHARDARDGRARDRGALGVQAHRQERGRRASGSPGSSS